ncbi:SMC-Scp complex subunit ScpB [bacterium]|nr:SMC-Scp complex subunit ScpB [bacterium]
MSDSEDADTEIDEDIESAYRRALAAMDIAEEEVGKALTELSEQPDADLDAEDAGVDQDDDSVASVAPTQLEADVPDVEDDPVNPRQVVEAVLFVGGEPVTAKKLCSVLRGDFQPEHMNSLIDELNDQYRSEQRPYEVRLLEGGYQIKLRPEFDQIHRKVYGMGSREVKLSQDALEILALVAYEQPISRGDVEEFGKKNAGSMLSQLVRRELLEVDRSAGGGKKLIYRTTQRFLSLFGIGHPDELPHMDSLQYK